MPLKYIIDNIETVPEAARGFYVKQGDKYVLDAEGVVPKERLDEFRNNNIELQKQIDKYKGVDPVKYAELMEIQRKIQEKELIEAGKVDEVVELRVSTMRNSYESEKTTLSTELSTTKRQLEVLLIDNVVKTAAIKLGVIPEAIDDVILRAKGTFAIEEGTPVPKSNGAVVYSKDGKTPMSVEEWLTSLKTTAKHLFLGSSGSGAGGGMSHGRTNTANMTPAEKIALGLQSSSNLQRPPSE